MGATFWCMKSTAARPRLPVVYSAAFHTSAAELAEIAKQAHPKLLVLYHQLYGGGCTDPALLEQVQSAYGGAVVSAKDFDVF
jgi:ribonuclease BN (tRNA processing enzyme)